MPSLNFVSNRTRETLLAGLLMFGLLIFFFNKDVFGGQVLIPSEDIFSTPFFSDVAPREFTKLSNPLLFDQTYQFVPWRHFAWESIRQGQIPLWNPYSYAGTPFVATMQSAVFYPINLLLTILPFEDTFVWSAILKLWIAGLFTYLLVRRYGLGLVAALVAAISFMFSGFLISWLGHPQDNVAIWLPALILFGEQLLMADSLKKTVRSSALLALVIGIQLTGGHIETFVDILSILGLYYFVRWFQYIVPSKISVRAKAARLLLFPGVAGVLGVAVGGIQLLPFLEWLPLSAEFHVRSSASFVFLYTGFWKDLLSLPVLVFPNIYNNPTWSYPYQPFLPWGNYNEFSMYVGILTLILGIIGLALAWNEPRSKVWALIGLVCWGMAFHLPIFDWLNQLPIRNLANAGRLRLGITFSLCILAGFGVRVFWTEDFQKRVFAEKLWVRLCGIVAFSGFILALASNTILPAMKDRIIAYGRQMVDLEYASRSTHSQALDFYYTQVDKIFGSILAAFRFDNISMYMPAIVAIGGLVLVTWRRRSVGSVSWTLKGLLLSLVVVDLFVAGYGYNPSIPRSNLYPVTPIVSRVTQDNSLFRFSALRQDLIPDTQMMFGLSDIRGLDFPTSWYNQYLNLVPERIPWLNYGAIFASVDSVFLKAINLNYFVTTNQEDLTKRDTELVSKQGSIYLGKLLDAQPRSYMVYDSVFVQTDGEALQILRASSDQVIHRVVLEDSSAPHLTSSNNVGSDQDNPQNDVSVISYEPNVTKWKVNTTEDGYLYNSDAYYPGWDVYLDGVPAKLYRANIAFRAVYIPKGEHTVVFRYEPLSVFAGAWLTLFSLALISIMLGISFVPKN